MERNSVREARNERQLVLEDKLIAPWTTELQRACGEARLSLRGRAIGLDLTNLTAWQSPYAPSGPNNLKAS
jgi:hypothetical protein